MQCQCMCVCVLDNNERLQAKSCIPSSMSCRCSTVLWSIHYEVCPFLSAYAIIVLVVIMRILYDSIHPFYINLCVTHTFMPVWRGEGEGECWKWPTATFSVTSVVTRWSSCLCSRLHSSALLSSWILNWRGCCRPRATCHCLSHYTREQSTCQPCAVVGGQRQSLQSSRL